MNPNPTISVIFILAGIFGALFRHLVEEPAIELPTVKNGKVYLGTLSGMFIGGCLGIFYTNSLLDAAMAGYVGASIITNALTKFTAGTPAPVLTIEQTIRKIAAEKNKNGDLCVRVANCESRLNPLAIHTNTDGSRDRGLFQINEKYHPEVTDAQAFDPEYSTRFFCDAVDSGHISWWNASRTCWDVA